MPFARCQDLPYVHTGRGNQRLREVLEAARTRVVRAAVVGSSMWTCPSGNGTVSFPTFCYQFNRVYGGTPETPFQAHGSYGAVNPPGQYCMRGAYSAPLGTASDLAASFYPPGVNVAATDMLSEATIPGPQHLLQHDCVSVHGMSPAQGARCFNTATGTIVCRNLVEGFPGSATGIRWRHMTTNSIAAGYFTGHTQRNIFSATDATLDTTNSGGGRIYKILQSPTLGLSGDRYLECVALGPNASGAKLRSLLQSYKNTSLNAGFALDSFSFGGGRLAQWWDSVNEVTHYANCGPVLKPLNYEIAFVFMGVNESLAMDSDQWFATLFNFVTWWRTNVSPDTLIVVCVDPIRLDANGTQADNADRYVGASYALADTDPLVTAFNGRRRLYDMGINMDVSMTGLTDRGAWASGTAYVANDFVNVDTRGFFADSSNTGLLPGSKAGNGTWRPWRQWYDTTTLDNVHLSPWGQRMQAETYASLIFEGSGFKVSDVDVAVPTSNTVPTRVPFNAARRLFLVNTGTARAIVDIPSSGLGKIPLDAGQAITVVHPQGSIMSGYADVLCPGNPANVRLIEDTSVSG